MPNALTGLAQRIAAQDWLIPLTTLLARVDLALLHRSRGRWGVLRLVGTEGFVLHTVGRRTGRHRETPLLCVADGGRFLVAASNWGKPSNPAWAHNLRAGGPVHITRGGRTTAARVRELTGPERDAAYALMGRTWSAYPRYAARTDRVIPVFELRV